MRIPPSRLATITWTSWVPACAGMTVEGEGMTVGAGVDALDRGAFIEIDDAALDAYLAAGTLLAIRTAITLSRVPSVRLTPPARASST